MDKLSIEEKAKAYDNMLEKARKWYNINTNEGYRGILEDIFPELKESEDERIKEDIITYLSTVEDKELIPYETWIAWLEKQVPIDEEKVLIGARKDVALSIMNFLDRNTLGMCLSNMECKDLEDAVVGSDWSKVYDYMKKKLEKQGEQKPADKVEPKFKVGDWLVHDMSDGRVTPPVQIIEMTNKSYVLDDRGCFYFSDAEEIYRKWTIEDAKDGDVLSYREGQWVFIFKKKRDENEFAYHILLSDIGFCVNDVAFSLLGEAIFPATKEQRNFLFQKMKENGYEWDAEKKELKKIEQKHIEWTQR